MESMKDGVPLAYDIGACIALAVDPDNTGGMRLSPQPLGVIVQDSVVARVGATLVTGIETLGVNSGACRSHWSQDRDPWCEL